MEQCDINPSQQILVYDSKLFSSIITEDMKGSDYPKVMPPDPIIIFNRENNNVGLQSDQSFRK